MGYLQEKIKARFFGGDVKRMISKGKIPDAEISLARLSKLGFKPELIFDVGAYHGSFSDICLKIWPSTQVTAFEALHEKIDKLKHKFKGKSVTVVEGIIGEEENDKVKFFSDETASSVLESEEVYATKSIVTQRMFTLDGFIGKEKPIVPCLLKIDTQGYEYQILSGFKNNLAKVKVILLELNFIEIYYHVKLAHEIIGFLAGYGFVPYDICEIHRRPLDNALFQMDFIFVKENSFLRQDKRWDFNKL